jgi:penicillin-binding protein 2
VRRSGNLDPEGIELCGKTGTAQNPHGKDHSVFMGFAPMEQPKIAVCCFVENGGFGATFGVPIGTLVIEKYLNGKISGRRKMMEYNMFHSSTLQYTDYKKK